MGYELDKLLNRYGVSAPTIPYSGALAEDQKPALQAYKNEYQQRVSDTPAYVGMPGSHMGPQKIAPQSRPMTPENKQVVRDFFSQNPNLTQDQIRAKQQEFGVNNTDIYAATGNYWGNTLRPPTLAPKVLPGDQGPPKPAGMAPNGPGIGPIPTATPEAEGPVMDDYGMSRRWDRKQGFAEGGFVDEDEMYGRGLDLSRVSPEQLAMLQRSDPQALQRGVARFAAPAAKPAARNNDLQDMLARYQNPSSDYAGELKAARARSSADSQAFQDMLKQAAEAQGDSGPSKSEMYFRLAAALGSPTKTGSFGESLGSAARVLGDHQAEVRQAQRTGAANKLQLALQGQQARMASSKEDLNTVRQLADEEMKGKRAEGTKIVEAYLKSGQPQSEAGKIAADSGLQPGTPEYSTFVKDYVGKKLENGDIFKQAQIAIAQGGLQIQEAGLQLRQDADKRKVEEGKKLTPQEMKVKSETETALNTMAQAYTDLKRAEKLNKDSFDNSVIDKLNYGARAAVGSKDPKTVNTGELTNILKGGTIATAAATLKTQISDGDIKLLGQIQGLDAKSQEERARIIASAKRRMAENYKIQKKKLADINAGMYRLTTPAEPEGLE